MLDTIYLTNPNFYLKVENAPYTLLSIERQEQELYFTHFLLGRCGDLFLDAEMVFNISNQGQLRLTQTATQNPFNGGEYRSNDRGFGQTFSSNLLAQGFAEATLSAFHQKQQSQQNQENSVVSKREEQATDSIASPASNATQAKPGKRPSLPEQPSLTTNSSKDEERPPLSEPSPTALHLSEPSASISLNRTKQSRIKSSATSKSTQVVEPQGLQLSLFDIGLNSNNATELKNVLQSPEQKVETEPVTRQQVEEVAASFQANNPPPSTSNQPGASTDNKSDRLVDPMRIFQQVVERVDKRTDEMLATLDSSSPSLNMLRDWYKAARELGKSQKHLDRISQTGNNFKQGEALTDKAIEVMTKDFQAHYKQLMIVEQLGNLGDRDLLALNQNITNYLNSPPPSPPPLADKQKVELEVKQLTERINSLGHQQAEQLATVESMQKSPFRSWNGKYEGAVAQVEQTANKLDNAIAHLQQRQNQLGQWNKQEMAYSLWDKSPQTMEMRSLAKGLQSPQLQERLSSIAKVERQEFGRSQTSSARQAGLSA